MSMSGSDRLIWYTSGPFPGYVCLVSFWATVLIDLCLQFAPIAEQEQLRVELLASRKSVGVSADSEVWLTS